MRECTGCACCWSLIVLGIGLWLVVDYCLYISEYQETDYVPSSCLMSWMQADGDNVGSIAVRFGNEWDQRSKFHQEYIGYWGLGEIETCYVDMNHINDNSASRWNNIFFFSPNAIIVLYYLIGLFCFV